MKTSQKKKLRYGSVTVALTALIVAAVVLLNVIFYALATRYLWYADMSSALSFTVSDECYDYIDEYIVKSVDTSKGEKITILFADDETAFKELAVTDVQYYAYKTARDLQSRYPDMIELKFLNIWIHPSEARKYGITASTNITVIGPARHATFKINEFFTFASSDSSTPIAYNGEKQFAIGMMWATQKDVEYCYFTVNHGEALYDYELMQAAISAGYYVSTLDLLSSDIPDDCGMLVTFNPTQDFTDDDGVSATSEVAKLDEYMANGGKYMIFVSADTFVNGSRPNMENFLKKWGVEFRHRYDGDSEVEFCSTVKDSGHSISSDGYTILGEYTSKGMGADVLADLRNANYPPMPVFSNATCIDYASGFASDGNGNMTDDSGKTISPLITSYPTSEIWSGGKISDRGQFNLMTTTKGGADTNGAFLVACGSVSFATEEALQSAVYANSYIISSVIHAMGKDNVPTKLTFKPFGDSTIDTITTSQTTVITAVLSVTPAIVALFTGCILLIRRKNR